MCPEVRASLGVVSFCSFLWLWIVGGGGDVEACVMLSDAFFGGQCLTLSGYSLVFPMFL